MSLDIQKCRITIHVVNQNDDVRVSDLSANCIFLLHMILRFLIVTTCISPTEWWCIYNREWNLLRSHIIWSYVHFSEPRVQRRVAVLCEMFRHQSSNQWGLSYFGWIWNGEYDTIGKCVCVCVLPSPATTMRTFWGSRDIFSNRFWNFLSVFFWNLLLTAQGTDLFQRRTREWWTIRRPRKR